MLVEIASIAILTSGTASLALSLISLAEDLMMSVKCVVSPSIALVLAVCISLTC